MDPMNSKELVLVNYKVFVRTLQFNYDGAD